MFTGQRVRLILNPASGNERGEQLAATIRSRVENAGAAELDLCTTGSAEDAVNWAAEAAADGYGIVLAAGGDGTVTGVAHGIRKAGTDTIIGIIPLGTGNGLARILNIPMDPVQAVASLAKGRTVAVDAMDVPSHDATSLLFLGAGLDAEINRDADADNKSRLGFMAYVQAAFSNLSGRRNHDVRLTLNGEEQQLQAHTVSIFNATRLQLFGAPVGPDAHPHDGVAEVAVLTSPGLWAVMGQVLRVVDRNASRPVLKKVKEVKVVAYPPMLVHIDGDVVGETPLEVRVLPGALHFIAGAGYKIPGT